MSWDVKIYETPSGQKVVEDFISSLEANTLAKYFREHDLLREYGITLGMPHAKAMGGGLFELRVRGKQEVRILYAFGRNKRVYLLHGFIKKTQSTPKRELEIAHRRQGEVVKYNL